jgi:hypothetical protein
MEVQNHIPLQFNIQMESYLIIKKIVLEKQPGLY